MARQFIDPEARAMTQAEVDAWRAEQAARKARRAERKGRGPLPVDSLTALSVGASHTFPQYKSTTQTSSTIRSAYVKTGAKFTSRVARSLLDGVTVIGVTVTRTV